MAAVKLNQLPKIFCAVLISVGIRMEQRLVENFAKRASHVFIRVTNIGNENRRRKIYPFIAAFVVYREIFRPVPGDGQLSLHGSRFVPLQIREQPKAFGARQVGLDFAEPGFYAWNRGWANVE